MKYQHKVKGCITLCYFDPRNWFNKTKRTTCVNKCHAKDAAQKAKAALHKTTGH